MNIKVVISVVILISLALMAYVFLDIGKAVEANDPIEDKVIHVETKGVDNTGINNTEQTTTKISQLPSYTQPVEQVSAEIVSFNEQLAKDLSLGYDFEFARINAVDLLRNKQRQGSADVVEEINKYFENIVGNQIEVSDLILMCKDH